LVRGRACTRSDRVNLTDGREGYTVASTGRSPRTFRPFEASSGKARGELPVSLIADRTGDTDVTVKRVAAVRDAMRTGLRWLWRVHRTPRAPSHTREVDVGIVYTLAE